MSLYSVFTGRSQLSAPIVSQPCQSTDSSQSLGLDAEHSLRLLNATVDTDQGLPIVVPTAVLAHFKDEITDTCHMLGVGDELFERQCIPVLTALAAYLQTLPATRSQHFRRPLGAMRRAILTGRACARAGTAVIFDPDASQTDRRLLQTHWRLGCWLAGVCNELGFLIDQLDVVDGDGLLWQPVLESQHAWAQRLAVSRVWLRWKRPTPLHQSDHSSGAAAYMSARIIPPEVLAHIHSGSGEIARVVLDCISGKTGLRGKTLFALVTSARESIALGDLQSDATHYGRPVIGVVLPQFIVSAMRSCIAEGLWTVNDRLSAVFNTPHGVFVKWPYAAKEIRMRLLAMNVAPTPADPDQILDALAEANLIVASPGTGLFSQLWTVHPEPVAKPFTAIKLVGPAVLCEDAVPWPIVLCRLTLPRDTQAAHSDAAAAGSSTPVDTANSAHTGKPARPSRRAEASPVTPLVGGGAAPTVTETLGHAPAASSVASLGDESRGICDAHDVVAEPSRNASLPTLERDWPSHIETLLDQRERIVMMRFNLHAKFETTLVSADTFARASIPFATLVKVLHKVGALTSSSEQAFTLSDDFFAYIQRLKA